MEAEARSAAALHEEQPAPLRFNDIAVRRLIEMLGTQHPSGRYRFCVECEVFYLSNDKKPTWGDDVHGDHRNVVVPTLEDATKDWDAFWSMWKIQGMRVLPKRSRRDDAERSLKNYQDEGYQLGDALKSCLSDYAINQLRLYLDDALQEKLSEFFRAVQGQTPRRVLADIPVRVNGKAVPSNINEPRRDSRDFWY